MTHPIGYYTGYDPKTQEPVILDKIQERFGSQFQRMTYEQKIVIWAGLTGFIAHLPVWKEDGNDITFIDCLLSV